MIGIYKNPSKFLFECLCFEIYSKNEHEFVFIVNKKKKRTIYIKTRSIINCLEIPGKHFRIYLEPISFYIPIAHFKYASVRSSK